MEKNSKADHGHARRPLLLELKMVSENQSKSLRDWCIQSAEYFYPEIGIRTYRVPAFYFNHQNTLTVEQAAKKNFVPPSVSSSLPATLSSESFSGQDPPASSGGIDFESDHFLNIKKSKRDPATCTRNDASALLPGVQSYNNSAQKLLCDDTDKDDRNASLTFPVPDFSAISASPELPSCSLLDDVSSNLHTESFFGNPEERLLCERSRVCKVQNDVSYMLNRNVCDNEQSLHLDCEESQASQAKRSRRTPHNCCNVSNKMTTNSESALIDDKQKKSNASSSHLEHFDTRPKKKEVDLLHIEQLSHFHSFSDKHHFQRKHSLANHLPRKTSSSECAKKAKPMLSKQVVVQPPLWLICRSQESMIRRDKALAVVLDAFESLGGELEKAGDKGLFIVCGVNYDNYLSRIPKTVRQEYAGGYLGQTVGCRGVLDILLLQERVGLVLVQVKSVGGNKEEWQASDSQVMDVLKDVLRKAQAKSLQLRRDFGRELLSDSDGKEPCLSNMFHVLALPFITRHVYQKTFEDNFQPAGSHELDVFKVLCKEDFQNSAALGMKTTARNHFFPSVNDSESKGGNLPLSRKSALHVWWEEAFAPTNTVLFPDTIKEIAGRICGIFSKMTVLPGTKCRAEVRTFGHSVSEAAERFGAPCLTVAQYDILQCQQAFVVLSGPPGSGKSWLLTLKAVQWLEQMDADSDHVVVASITRAGIIPPGDCLLYEAINQRKTSDRNRKHLLRVVYSLDPICPVNTEHEIEKSLAELMERVREGTPSGQPASGSEESNELIDIKLHFVLNDLDPNDENIQSVLQALYRHPCVRSVWWSTSQPLEAIQLGSPYKLKELREVTRRPMHVQHVLKTLEWRNRWKDAYNTTSDESLLPTEGPQIVYTRHGVHRQDFSRGYHCAPDCQTQQRQIPEKKHCRENWQQYDPYSNPALEKDQVNFQQERDKKEGNQSQDWTRYKADQIHEPSLNKEQNDSDLNSDTHSPFSCDFCANAVSNTISELVWDSTNPKLSSFVAGTVKLFKDPSKNKFGSPIKPRDILIVTTFPQQDSGHVSSQPDIRGYLKSLAQSRFVMQVQNRIPLKVLTEEANRKIACPKNHAVLTDAASAHGLERKVVIYVGSCPQKPHCKLQQPENVIPSEGKFVINNALCCSISGTHPNEMKPHLFTCERNNSPEDLDRPSVVVDWNSNHFPLESSRNDFIARSETSPENAKDNKVVISSFAKHADVLITQKTGTPSNAASSHIENHLLHLASKGSCDLLNEVFDAQASHIPDQPNTVKDENVIQEPVNFGSEFNTNSINTFRSEIVSKSDSDPEDEREAATGDSDSDSHPVNQEGQLPSWMVHKINSNPLASRFRTIAKFMERFRPRKICADLSQGENTMDSIHGGKQTITDCACEAFDTLLCKLDEVNRRGLYAAASCCLAQLVIVFP